MKLRLSFECWTVRPTEAGGCVELKCMRWSPPQEFVILGEVVESAARWEWKRFDGLNSYPHSPATCFLRTLPPDELQLAWRKQEGEERERKKELEKEIDAWSVLELTFRVYSNRF